MNACQDNTKLITLLDELCLDSIECHLDHLIEYREHSEKQHISNLYLQVYDALTALLAERDALREALKPFWRELEADGTIGSAIESMEERNWHALAVALDSRHGG